MASRSALLRQEALSDCLDPGKAAGFKSLPSKTATGTTDGPLDVLSTCPPPFAVWTDNGTELKCGGYRKTQRSSRAAEVPHFEQRKVSGGRDGGDMTRNVVWKDVFREGNRGLTDLDSGWNILSICMKSF
jgi:hypothetical protein